MADAGEDLQILYRAVSRKQGRAIAYAGCVTAPAEKSASAISIVSMRSSMVSRPFTSSSDSRIGMMSIV